jgi:hypothetical protein
MDAKEAIERDFQRQIKFNYVKEYNYLGYKGHGITILNTESYPGKDGHGEMTTGVINDYAPEALVLNSQIKGSGRNRFLVLNNKNIEFEEAIRKYKIKLITSSTSVAGDSTTLNYYKELQEKYGIIFFCAAGNYGDEGISSKWAKNDTAITVGSVRIKENETIEKMYYSSNGEELDFMCFMAKGNGTSSASPGLTSLVALLLNKYGDFNQAECIEILKSLCVYLGEKSSYGYGLPVLPLTDKLEILETLRKGSDEMEFNDVEETRWSKPAIDRCVAEGLLLGFEDGTFRPTENVTREQFATILTRILDKIEGR